MIKFGQSIFIAFQNGKCLPDSQNRPRMYSSLKKAQACFPAWRDGKCEFIEYIPMTHQSEQGAKWQTI